MNIKHAIVMCVQTNNWYILTLLSISESIVIAIVRNNWLSYQQWHRYSRTKRTNSFTKYIFLIQSKCWARNNFHNVDSKIKAKRNGLVLKVQSNTRVYEHSILQLHSRYFNKVEYNDIYFVDSPTVCQLRNSYWTNILPVNLLKKLFFSVIVFT